MKPKFKTLQNGLEVIDPIERCRDQLTTSTSVTPTSVNTDRIPYPVETAVEISTERVTLHHNSGVLVRDSDGSLVTEVRVNERVDLSSAEYIIDASNRLKIYLKADSEISIRVRSTQVEIVFGESCPVAIGVRSYHRRPAEMITTTPEPTDVMQAVSLFGSALKTIGPERSYPTLRGHPPAITLGDELKIPEPLERPDTGIRIEIPPTLYHVFVVTPLAYYLAADVVPGPEPRLITDTGFSQELTGTDGLESTVERILKQIVLLDCLVRIEGTTPLPLHERQVLEPRLDLDIPSVYAQSIPEQLETYLTVPFESIASEVPDWHLETYVSPIADHIEFLPSALNRLTTFKTTDGRGRSAENIQTAIDVDQQTTNSEVSSTIESRTDVVSTAIPTVQEVWNVDDRIAVGGTRTVSSYKNSITQTAREGPLRIVVICNDDNMGRELVDVHSSYESREDMPLEVTVHHNLSASELRAVFRKKSDFVHYIGHVDADGFRCADRTLDAKDLETVGAKAFFLNACHSYEQGLSLIEAGSVGGIVTRSDIQNSTAVAAGNTLAQLLNAGLPLYAALNILQVANGSDGHYHILGEGALAVSQTKNGGIMATEIDFQGGTIDLCINSYISATNYVGGINIPHLESVDSYYLVPKKIDLSSVAKPEVVKFLNTGEFPVLLEGELRWSTDVKSSEL